MPKNHYSFLPGSTPCYKAGTYTRAPIYRFARGETIISNTGQQVKLSSPLEHTVDVENATYLNTIGARLHLANMVLTLNGRPKKLSVELLYPDHRLADALPVSTGLQGPSVF